MMRRSAIRLRVALLLACSFPAGCVRAPESDDATTPEPGPPACAEPDRFGVEFTRSRVESWQRTLAGSGEDAPWREAWARSAMEGLERARRVHAEVFERGCSAASEQVDAWSQRRSCLDEARALIAARFDLAASWAGETPERLALAPDWPWRLEASVARCASDELSGSFTAFDSRSAASREADMRARWYDIWARAELGDLEGAGDRLEKLRGEFSDLDDGRLRFEMDLLSAWLDLAADRLPAAEARLGTLRTAASALGDAARLDFAFFESGAAAYAGDVARAAATLDEAHRLARSLGRGFESARLDAATQQLAAVAQFDPNGIPGAAQRLQAALSALPESTREPSAWRWAAELLLEVGQGEAKALEGAKAAQQAAFGAGHPALRSPGPAPTGAQPSSEG